MMMGQPRIFLAKARDGLMPVSFFGAVHSKFQTPYKSTILTGLVVASAASLLPLNILADYDEHRYTFRLRIGLHSVLILRIVDPKRRATFQVPIFTGLSIAGHHPLRRFDALSAQRRIGCVW